MCGLGGWQGRPQVLVAQIATTGPYPAAMDSWLVVGLGNPGPKYAGNRHNVGAMVVTELAHRGSVKLARHKGRASAVSTRLSMAPGGGPGPAAVLAIPSGYMNESGGPVSSLLSYYSLTPERLIVVHDELDIGFGQVRLKRGGGEGGHNGLRSVSASIGTRDYLRVRVGIGRPPGRMDPADFVLRDFCATERVDLPFVLDGAADAVELLAAGGLTSAQQRFHAP